MAEVNEREIQETAGREEKLRPKRRWGLRILAVFLLLVTVFVLSLPWLVTVVPVSPVDIDLDPFLNETNRVWFTNRRVTARIDVQRGVDCDYVVRARGDLLDWPYIAEARLNAGWLFVEGKIDFRLLETPWRVSASILAESSRIWMIDLELPETPFDEKSAVIGELLGKILPESIAKLTLSGSVGFTAHAHMTAQCPVPVWNAKARLRNLDAALEADGQSVVLRQLNCAGGASGIADHVDIAPLFPRAAALEVGDLALTNLFASVRATESAFLITEAGTELAGGQVRLYSLFLNPEKLNVGVTLYLDGIDAGAVLARLSGFKGEASGRLHGKVPLRLRQGRELVLGDSYLYSIPGEKGTLRLEDPKPVLDNLALGGVPKETRDNLEKALECLDYSVLKFDLKREEDGFALMFLIEGTATRGKTTVPVSFSVTFHGDFDHLVNLGLKAAQKGKQP